MTFLFWFCKRCNDRLNAILDRRGPPRCLLGMVFLAIDHSIKSFTKLSIYRETRLYSPRPVADEREHRSPESVEPPVEGFISEETQLIESRISVGSRIEI